MQPSPYLSSGAIFDPNRFACSDVQMEELAEHSSRFVFVFGYARSGTTILANAINSIPDVCMLYEDNPQLVRLRTDYAAWYSHELCVELARGGMYMKGFMQPSYGLSEGLWGDYYLRSARRWRLFGSKIALGPHDYWTPDTEYRTLDFFMSLFPRAHYFLTIREPLQTIESTMEQIATADVPTIMRTYLRTLAISIRMALTFQNHTLVPLAGLSQSRVEKVLAPLLQDGSGIANIVTEIPVGASDAGAAMETLRLGAGLGPAMASIYSLYTLFIDSIVPEQGSLGPDVHAAKYMAAVNELVTHGLAAIDQHAGH